MGLNMLAAVEIVAPAIGRTALATIKGKKKKEGDPTKEASYRETLKLMRRMLLFTALNTVEDLQYATTGWLPHPPSVIVKDVVIPSNFYDDSARYIQENLGPANLNRVGKTWWQWRRPGSEVKAEWVEMKTDYLKRKRSNNPIQKVMFYIHGGAYYLGAIGHLGQIQRHARKLKGRVFAPRYRLAPQFPFPCAIQDILSAYLYLLTIQHHSNIVIAGDSAGGGLCVALLLILRDQGIPLPAGASLISPWVDLTCSFPSITIPSDLDYLPAHGFHAKPSLSWPPPSSEELKALRWPVHVGDDPDYEVVVDGENLVINHQIQMYAPNSQLQIPLVSGVCAASLGGLCPLQVLVGGGEIFRDEQIYLAHKAADPARYAPCDEILAKNGNTKEDVTAWPPTSVLLQVFEDCPHAAPTLSHTHGAKYQYRSIAHFAAWAFENAQKPSLNVTSDTSVHETGDYFNVGESGPIGQIGDSLPLFNNHMIRQLVKFDGKIYPLEPASKLRACNVPATDIGFPKEAAYKSWLQFRKKSDKRYASELKKVYKERERRTAVGYRTFPDGEVPPPSALAGRIMMNEQVKKEKPRGRIGKSIIGIFNKADDRSIRGDVGRKSAKESM
ncbi:hypothetical protein BP6252_10239 [Coleophoma cylindrospora]|uniref:Alpha/beta hydrolase fold-3 domain-containing protein n=1 Tax=Coleophoma cylindrospora TaxID=1849047 RepID=A0A3D8QSD6_9HELO|nr:hypothetical protein BP6252_10239 [Coleophoma cylindrospora]